MKIRKIIVKKNEEIAILIKRDSELISITVDEDGNIDVNGYDNDMVLLEELAYIQLQNQQIENDLLKNIINMPNIDEASFMQDEEE